MRTLTFDRRTPPLVSLTPFCPTPSIPTFLGGGPLPSHQLGRGEARFCAHRLHRHGTTPNQDQLWTRHETSQQVLHLRSRLWSLRHARGRLQVNRRAHGGRDARWLLLHLFCLWSNWHWYVFWGQSVLGRINTCLCARVNPLAPSLPTPHPPSLLPSTFATCTFLPSHPLLLSFLSSCPLDQAKPTPWKAS